MSIIWHNGSYIKEAPVLYAHDRLRLGEGVFDVIPAIDGRLCHADWHFEKLIRAGNIFFGTWSAPKIETLKSAAQELLEHNNMRNGKYMIRTLITRGPGGDGIKLPETENLQIAMRASPIPVEFPSVKAIVAQTVRRNEGSPLSRIKCANYGESVLALREATEKNANDALMLNNAGRVACATTSNIFIVKSGALLTPPLTDGTQEGVTRRLLIEKLGAKEQSLSLDDLFSSEGIYLTNSVRGVVTVEMLDGRPLPRPSLGIDKDFHLI